MFDDHLEHESWNFTAEPRIVLIIDLWHPDLTPARGRAARGPAPLRRLSGGQPEPLLGAQCRRAQQEQGPRQPTTDGVRPGA
ncbi:MAG: aspartyl/asparaginyl beta-hydroxylase domain-containing protein [Pseudomonadota bacterium]